MSIADLELERIAARGWQAAEEQWVGGWLLRANGGFTGRANSVLPLGDPGMALDAALESVHAFYAGFDLRARFTVPRPARDDLRTQLLARGWTPSWGATAMVADLAELPAPAGRPCSPRSGRGPVRTVPRRPTCRWPPTTTWPA